MHQLKYIPDTSDMDTGSCSIPLTNQAWIQQLKYTPENSGTKTAAEVYP
jgi:hypothetical protein